MLAAQPNHIAFPPSWEAPEGYDPDSPSYRAAFIATRAQAALELRHNGQGLPLGVMTLLRTIVCESLELAQDLAPIGMPAMAPPAPLRRRARTGSAT